jgi:hypothetical protein
MPPAELDEPAEPDEPPEEELLPEPPPEELPRQQVASARAPSDVLDTLSVVGLPKSAGRIRELTR